MRKLFPIVTGLFFAFLFIACKQYTHNIEEYLSYWASEAYVKAHTVRAVQHHDKDSVLCVPSASDVAVALSKHNPKNFPLVMPASPADAAIVIRFPGLDPQPEYGTSYTLE